MKLALVIVSTLALDTGYAQLFDIRSENPSISEAVYDESSFSLNSSEPAFSSSFLFGHDSQVTNSAGSGEIFASLDLNLGVSEHGAAWLYTISITREPSENRESWNDLPIKPWIELTPSIEPAFERPVFTLAAAGGPAFQSIRPARSATANRSRDAWVLASKDAARWRYGMSASWDRANRSGVAVLFDPATSNRFNLTEDRGDKPLRAMFDPVIPEPSTYATATALLLAAFTIVRRRMQR